MIINQVTIGGTSPASFWRKLGIRLLQKLSLPAMLCTLLSIVYFYSTFY